jgi:hypothetical protein
MNGHWSDPMSCRPDGGAVTGRFYGIRQEYRWYQAADLCLGDVLAKVPGLVLDRFVVVTSFDSGALRLTESERGRGWRTVGSMAISPRIKDLSTLPHDEYDEWYVYEDPPILGAPEVFVNYGGFSLRQPELQVEQVDATWDQSSSRQRLDWLRAAQDRFWRQIDELRPETYLADGDTLICVTRSAEDLFAKPGQA